MKDKDGTPLMDVKDTKGMTPLMDVKDTQGVTLHLAAWQATRTL